MRRADVIDGLTRNKDAIKSNGVDALYLFGSHVRDEARELGRALVVLVFPDPEAAVAVEAAARIRRMPISAASA